MEEQKAQGGGLPAAVGGFVKKHKVAAAAAAVALVAAVLWLQGKSAGAPAGESFTFIRTTTLAKNSLRETVSVSGTVSSGNMSTVTVDSAVRSYPVKTVNVQVGDTVQEGDVICTLDTADLEKSIQQARERSSESKETLLQTYEKRLASYEDASASYNEAVEKQNKALADSEAAAADYAAKEAERAENWGRIYLFQENVDTLKGDMANKLSLYQTAQEQHRTESLNWETACAQTPEGEPEPDRTALDTAAAAEAEAKLAYEEALRLYNDAAAELNTAKNALGYSSMEQSAQQAKSSMEQAQTAYQNAVKQTETAKKQMDSAYKDAQDALKSYNEGGTSEELEKLLDQLAKCTITAKTSGTVTGLNAVVGSVISDVLATVQDTEDLRIGISLAEYDVKKVALGMACEITSDATDGVIGGTVTQISPTSSNGSFSAEVTVNGGSNGLLIGMNAAVEIICSSVENVYTVPYDAVGRDENGSFVYVKTGGQGADAVFDKSYVTVGESNDYYVIVSGEGLQDGLEIRATADLTVGAETLQEGDSTKQEGDSTKQEGDSTKQDMLSITVGEPGGGRQGGQRGERPAGGMQP